ncbi:MAG: hypothetical protein NT038_02640 [Euryarchaeota archaeon]|nr:hypothetical protein [Euryarchaeota archaeon]
MTIDAVKNKHASVLFFSGILLASMLLSAQPTLADSVHLPLSNQPPNKPINPTPEQNATNVNITPTLSIYVSDPENDNLTVTFYNASNNNTIVTKTNISSNSTVSIIWYNLSINATYKWYVVVNDTLADNRSDTWFFNTSNQPPNKPINPAPEHNEKNVNLTPTLSVYVSDLENNNMMVSFYNASDNSLLANLTNITSGTTVSAQWPNLSLNMTYQWYVIVNDSFLENRSDTFQFFTKKPVQLAITFKGGLGVHAIITNIGETNATDMTWNLVITGKGLLRKLNTSTSNTNDLYIGTDLTINKFPQGFGRIEVQITAQCPGPGEQQFIKNAKGFVFWHRVFLRPTLFP